jgi:hypothetical protein
MRVVEGAVLSKSPQKLALATKRFIVISTVALPKETQKTFCWRGRRGQIIGRWGGDTVIGVRHQQPIVTLVEGKRGDAILVKVRNNTADLVGCVMIDHLQPVAPLVKTMTFDKGKEFAEQAAGIE